MQVIGAGTANNGSGVLPTGKTWADYGGKWLSLGAPATYYPKITINGVDYLPNGSYPISSGGTIEGYFIKLPDTITSLNFNGPSGTAGWRQFVILEGV